MPIHVSWLDDSQMCIYQYYDGDWSVEEFIKAQLLVAEMRKSVSHNVHRIVNVLDGGPMPAEIVSALKHLVNNHDIRRTNLIYVNNSPAYKVIIDLFAKIYSSFAPHIFEVESMEEALAILDNTGKVKV